MFVSNSDKLPVIIVGDYLVQVRRQYCDVVDKFHVYGIKAAARYDDSIDELVSGCLGY